EGAGATSKRAVSKLKLIPGPDWAVVIGGAGDGRLSEIGMQELGQKLAGRQTVTQRFLLDAMDKILDSLHRKYIDKDKDCEGVAFIIGAVCGNQLHLISTTGRIPQTQDAEAYAGLGEDIAVFFLDRLRDDAADWTYTAKVAGF